MSTTTHTITLKIKYSELLRLRRGIRNIEHLAMKGGADEYLGYEAVRSFIENAWVNLDSGDTAEWDGQQWHKEVQA